jgi:hypothetical protein
MSHCERIVCKHNPTACTLNTEPQTLPKVQRQLQNATPFTTLPSSMIGSGRHSAEHHGADESSDTTHQSETSTKQEASEPKVGDKRPHPSSDSSMPCKQGPSPTCDSTTSQCEPASDLSTPASRTARIYVPVSAQMSNKARLLHYFPPDPATYHLAGDWCGWHYDIGTITGVHFLSFVLSWCH